MQTFSIHSKRKWFPVLVIGFSLFFFGLLASFVLYAFVRSAIAHSPNWGIFGFGCAIGFLAVYLFVIWIPNLTTITLTDDKIAEMGLKGWKVIPVKDIISLNADDEKQVKALWTSTVVSCATIRSARHTISLMYGNYENGDEMKQALEKIARGKHLPGTP